MVEELYYLCSETKALISFAVTAKLICVFVFAYAKCLFSHSYILLSPNRLLRERPFDFYGGGGGGGGGQEDYIGPGIFFRPKLNPVYFFECCLILDIFFSHEMIFMLSK